MTKLPTVPESLSADLLWGAESIADELGVTVDRIYYLIRTQKLPIKKLGPKLLVASRRELRAALSASGTI
jgi:hypothetical protein